MQRRTRPAQPFTTPRPRPASLEVALGPDQMARLDDLSAPEPMFPYSGYSAYIRRSIFGGADVTGW